MQETPLVSICCITYNHAPFIRKCLDGFLMQEKPSCVPADAKMSDWCEILIHDDCSTDGTTEIIKEYADKYPELIFPLYEETNQYDPNCPNKMDMYNYKRVRGKYIAYCEGDDYWTDSLKLKKQVGFLETHHDYSVTFHRCKHYNVEDGTEKDDQCGFLFQKEDEGVDITLEMFFDKWITQPLSMVCRVSMHDISLFDRYKHFRDMHEIYHLLKAGKGYLFSFCGGVRNMHPNGVASQISRERYCELSLPADSEFYWKTKDVGPKKNYLETLQTAIDEYSRNNKCKALRCALIHLDISHRIKTFCKNIRLISMV